MKFYMLYCPGRLPPAQRHLTIEAALDEAKRLIRARGRTEVYVLTAKLKVEPDGPPIRITDIV